MTPVLFKEVKLKVISLPTDLLPMIAQAVKESEKISIVTDAHIERGAFYIKKYKQLIKILEDHRKKDVAKLNLRVKLINTDYKAVTSAFAFEPLRLGSELTDYMRKKRELEEIERKKEQDELDDALIKEAEIFDDETVLDVEQKIEIKREKLNTEHLTTARQKKWRLIDFGKVPREYLLLDEVALNKIRKADEFDATSNIPGIEFFTDEVARL